MVTTGWSCSATLLRSSLLPAKLQDLRFGMKIIFSFKTDNTDGREVVNSSHGSSTRKICAFVRHFALPLLNENILGVTFAWTKFLAVNK